MTFASCTARAALLCAALAAAAAASAPGEGVTWLTDYAAARREAHDRNLPLVIDFSTDNCLYCRKLESVTFRDPAVVKLVKEHYVALHLHVGAGGGKEAAGLAQTLGVQGFPTLIFADPNGKVISRQDGFMEPAEFARTAQHVLAEPAAADRPGRAAGGAPDGAALGRPLLERGEGQARGPAVGPGGGRLPRSTLPELSGALSGTADGIRRIGGSGGSSTDGG